MSLVDLLIHQATKDNSPISGTFELTARCNLSCKMCYIHNASCDHMLHSNELTTQQWIDIAEEAKNHGTLIVLLTGGEPMLRNDFCEIYRACAERGFLLTVNTNATLLTNEIFDLFREHPPLRINASLYGMNENIYKSMCGNGAAFHRATENLKRLREMGIAIQINFMSTPYNENEVEKVHQFSEQIGARMQHTAYMFPPTRTANPSGETAVRFSPEDAAKQMTRFLRCNYKDADFAAICREKANEPLGRIDECSNVSDSVRCRAGRAAYWITYDGKMLPCGMLPNIDFSVLSDGFQSAWSRTIDAFSSIKMPHGCTQCPEYDGCDVCPAICYAEYGDFSAVPHYICQKNAAYRSQLLKFAEDSEVSACT